MSIFDCYARYYDLLYKDKDYAGEAQHVHEIIQRNSPGTKSILELGCGTCGHAVHLASKGYTIHGVDRSREMLDRADNRLKQMPHTIASDVTLSQGDIRAVRLDRRFDAVIALFHVVSYLPANDDIKATFDTAKAHLKNRGIFAFDCWYGPAVLTDRPSARVKRMEDERLSVVRVAEPVIHANRNLVEVSYQVFVKDKASGKTDILQETHVMRYLFKPEVELLLGNAGFQTVECFEWMTGREPGFDTWSVCFVGRS
jgi:SAM-dependent methyltransferase